MSRFASSWFRAFLVCLLLSVGAGCGSHRTEAPVATTVQARAGVTPLDSSFEPLRMRFEQDSRDSRLLLLISPS